MEEMRRPETEVRKPARHGQVASLKSASGKPHHLLVDRTVVEIPAAWKSSTELQTIWPPCVGIWNKVRPMDAYASLRSAEQPTEGCKS